MAPLGSKFLYSLQTEGSVRACTAPFTDGLGISPTAMTVHPLFIPSPQPNHPLPTNPLQPGPSQSLEPSLCAAILTNRHHDRLPWRHKQGFVPLTHVEVSAR
jgi:hypothetical protein